MFLSTAKWYMKNLVRILFWSIKESGDILDNLKLEISMRQVRLHLIYLLFTLLYLKF